jgi:hypothetical protein
MVEEKKLQQTVATQDYVGHVICRLVHQLLVSLLVHCFSAKEIN